MRDWLRTLIAGYAGYKWGGGCLGTIVDFRAGLLGAWALLNPPLFLITSNNAKFFFIVLKTKRSGRTFSYLRY